LITQYCSIEEITARQFPVFQEANSTVGDLLVLASDLTLRGNLNVSILKALIKENKAQWLKNINASDLHLWQVSFPIDVWLSDRGSIPDI
jgi:F0F1-type ATP synthase gamma subunit